MALLDKNGMRLSIIPESVISRAMQERSDFEADVFVPDLDDANHPAWKSPDKQERRAADEVHTDPDYAEWVLRSKQIRAGSVPDRSEIHSLNEARDRALHVRFTGRNRRKLSRAISRFGDAVWDFVEDYRPLIAGLMALMLAGVGIWAIVRAGAQLL